MNDYRTLVNNTGEVKVAKNFLIGRVNNTIKQSVTFTDFARTEGNVSSIIKMF
jgi:hypothetical protein